MKELVTKLDSLKNELRFEIEEVLNQDMKFTLENGFSAIGENKFQGEWRNNGYWDSWLGTFENGTLQCTIRVVMYNDSRYTVCVDSFFAL